MTEPRPRRFTGDEILYSDYRKTEELGTLRQVARALAAGTNAADVLQTICDAAMVQGRASDALVAEVSADTDAIIEPDFQEDGSVMRLPLMAQNQLVGVLSVFRRDGHAPFDADDEDRLAAVADLAALALWKARLLEHAQTADAAKTSLLATLSHELRTPLAALEGYGELLEDEILGPLSNQQRDVLVRLRTVGRHLGALIEDILTYASLEADRLSVRLSPVEVGAIVDDVMPYVEPLAREKGIDFEVEVSDPARELETDQQLVRQVLLNLIQNAVKFTERGVVSLRVVRGSPTGDDAEWLRFVVRDTGIGISANDLSRLFRPFSQLADVHTRRHRGTGLGLYISRRLATLLGGRIEVVSRPGEGSQFSLVLPVARRHQ